MSKIAIVTEVTKRFMVIENDTVVNDGTIYTMKGTAELSVDNLNDHVNIETYELKQVLELNGRTVVEDDTERFINTLVLAIARNETIAGITPEKAKEMFDEDKVAEIMANAEHLKTLTLNHGHRVECECECHHHGGHSDTAYPFPEYHQMGVNGQPLGEEVSRTDNLFDLAKKQGLEMHDLKLNTEVSENPDLMKGTPEPKKRAYQRKRDIGDYVVLPDSSIKYGYMMLRKNHPTVEKIMETERTTINVVVNGDNGHIAACDLLEYRINGLTALFKAHGEEVRSTPLELQYNKKSNTLNLITRPDITEESVKENGEGNEE